MKTICEHCNRETDVVVLTTQEKPVIKPTVGRKLWLFHPDGGINTAEDQDGTEQPVDATIVAVHSDTCVNVAGFDAIGNHFARTSVLLWDGHGSPPLSMHVEWMPYQQAQAKVNGA